MGVKSDKDLGINSWLEDELYKEYLHDRAAVDESWKHVFDDTRGGNGRAVAPVEAGNAAPAAISRQGPRRRRRKSRQAVRHRCRYQVR